MFATWELLVCLIALFLATALLVMSLADIGASAHNAADIK